ncbi:MAG: hypothetical protein JXA95_16445, partial [Spirochaetales bacterium]|nr:hypothetical protein [Spirochaetales bacterium]
MNLIGLDIGTTTIGGVLYSLKERKTLRTEVRENRFLRENPEEYLQDPAAIEGQVRAILDELIEDSVDEIGGISLSAQMHGILYVDREGRPVTSYYTWQNQRGLAPAGETTLEKEVSHALGYPVFSGYGIVTHTSLEREGLIPREAAKFCNIGDYVMMRLAGNREPVTDITLGASMGIVSLQTGTLPENREIFPRIVSSTEQLGTYRGIPLIQPIGDNQASFLGSVKNRENSLLLNYGTAGQISFAGKEYASYPHFETRPLGNEGYLFAAFSLCGGKSYSLMADFFAAAVRLFSHGESRNPFAVMDGMDLDFSEKEIDCLPLFLGERDGEGEFAWFRNITDRN